MSTKQIAIPQDFMLGAAASAWQTEGWSGKKPGQDSWIDLWYKNDRHVWHNGYGPGWQPTLSTASAKTWR